jgi:macrolide-specific efflux system membrane fusion protein
VVAAIVAAILVLHPFGTSTASAATSTSNTTQLTSTVQEGVVSSTITASGSVAPVSEVSSSFGTSGTIATVDVAVGSTVTAGQTLGTIDPTALTKAQASANTQLQSAEQQVSDAEAAAAAPATSSAGNGSGGGNSGGGNAGGGSTASAASQATSAASQVISAKTQLATAQAAYDTATSALGEATLTAPIAGVVVAVNGSVGSSTQAGSTVEAVAPSGTAPSSSAFVTIANTSSLTVTASIAEADIASVSIGQVASVSFPALTDVTAPAKVSAIAPTSTSGGSTVAYATTITLDSVPTGLRLGQTAEVSITTKTSGKAEPYVPTAAITTANGVSTVKVVESDGTTKSTTVTLGVAGDVGTAILSGLAKGQTVVIGAVSATQSSSGTGATIQQSRFGGATGGAGGTGGFGGGTGGFGGRTGGGFGGGRTG